MISFIHTSERDSEPNLFLQLYNLNGQKIGNKLNLDDFGSTTTNHGILVKAISESEIYVLTNTANGNSNQALKLKVENNELKLDEIIENIHAGIGNRGINSDLFVFNDQTVNIYSQNSSEGATQFYLDVVEGLVENELSVSVQKVNGSFKFFIDDIQQNAIKFQKDQIYKFDWSKAPDHPLKFSTTPDGKPTEMELNF